MKLSERLAREQIPLEIHVLSPEITKLEDLLIRLRNFVVKAEGHYLYGEKWTDWVDPHLPCDALRED